MRVLRNPVIFFIVFVVALLEGFYIYRTKDLSNSVGLSPYSFYDSKSETGDSLVTASGSWISSTDLANPLSTVSIECWKEFEHCWIADATIFDFGSPILSSGLNLHEIKYWNDDFIETKPSSPLAGCVEETYRIDRRSKTATYTRTTIKNTGTLCEGIQKEPISSTLGDGLRRIEVYKNNQK